MRTRNEIERVAQYASDKLGDGNSIILRCVLEAILDIRDLLALHAPEVTEKEV